MVGFSPTTLTFVLPYKRFAAPCLLARAQEYLEQPRASYRRSVRDNRSLIGYPVVTPEDGTFPHQAVVAHGLIWRFVGWLGSLTPALDEARSMILQGDPNSLSHRQGASVDPYKARSPERMGRLETALQLLQIIPDWEGRYRSSFFPRFATRAGFG